MTITLPIKTVSEANSHTHWRLRQKRAKAQRHHAWVATTAAAVKECRSPSLASMLPCVVTVTRLSPGTLDAHDNLRSACKHVVDGIADAFNVKDRDPRISWRYGQRRSREYGVEITIEPREVEAMCKEMDECLP